MGKRRKPPRTFSDTPPSTLSGKAKKRPKACSVKRKPPRKDRKGVQGAFRRTDDAVPKTRAPFAFGNDPKTHTEDSAQEPLQEPAKEAETKTVEPSPPPEKTTPVKTEEPKTEEPSGKVGDNGDGAKEVPEETKDGQEEPNQQSQPEAQHQNALPPPEPAKPLTPAQKRSMEKLNKGFGKKLPPITCNTCAFTTQCPQFRPDYECGFTDIIESVHLEGIEDIKLAQLRIIEANLQTAELGLIQQRLAGGIIDDKTSSRLDAAHEQLNEMRKTKVMEDRDKGIPPGAGSDHISGPRIIERLFGDLGKIGTKEDFKDAEGEVIVEPPPEELPDKQVEAELKTHKETELDEVLDDFAKEF